MNLKNAVLFYAKSGKRKSAYHESKNQLILAALSIECENVHLTCNLVRGVRVNGEYYYYVELPCFYFKCTRTQRIMKKNLVNIIDSEESEAFQATIFKQALEKVPFLFEKDKKREKT